MALFDSTVETTRPREAASAPAASGFSLKNIAVRADGRTLLSLDDLSFQPGELCGLIGHNGSGKSTMLKLLARQLTPDHGEVFYRGRPVSDFASREFARAIAWLPQSLPAADSMTVAELVALGRYPWHGALGRFSASHQQACDEAIAATGIETLSDRLVDTLSGGERQRAFLAMLIAQAPECMLLDEPIAALDLVHQISVMELVRACARERGMSVIVVLHDVNIAARFCDRIVALRQGQVVHDLAPGALMSADILGEIYGLPMHVTRHPETGAALAFAH